MKSKQIVIGKFQNEIDAEIAKGHLESEGIESYIWKDDSGGMLLSLNTIEGIKLVVAEEDAERAKEILGENEQGEEDT